LLTIVAGIHPDAPGFARVRIAPNPGSLTSFQAVMPRENSEIRVEYEKTQNESHFHITLPKGLPGVLAWHGKDYPLQAGEQDLRLP
jgi:alpha-L-rhamnosidase